MVSDPGVTEQLRAAAALLLQPPDERTLSILQSASGERLDPGEARQDFYDTFCIPRSGRYIPPYRHVISGARELRDYWYFPPPRYNGGDGLISWYETIGFDVSQLNADVLLTGPNRPLDHLGYLLAFLSAVARSSDENPELFELGSTFTGEFLSEWPRLYVSLLSRANSVYLHLVADALNEALDRVNEHFPPQAIKNVEDMQGETSEVVAD
jgi:hypothetical protein